MNHPTEKTTSSSDPDQKTQPMNVHWEFDHINVTAPAGHPVGHQLVALLGLSPGYRPPFSFPGAWFYQVKDAVLHMVDAEASEPPQLNHIAFRSQARLEDVLALIRDTGLPYQMARVPEAEQIQIFIPLVEGLLIELDIPLFKDISEDIRKDIREDIEPLDSLNSLDQLKEL
ncbi:hypothetical protein BTA51_03315 [Hahella sp. CCB-MM4]|nr:hypothetical protein BTA51_03315 [Hahella sp. CCB-MM4]